MSAVRDGMTGATPKTKLGPTPPEAGLIERPRLTEVLSSGFANPERRLTVLSAPAGYGKTTLMAQWARTFAREGTMVAWCTLDSDDRDPEVLWTTTKDALHLAAGRSREKLRNELASLDPGRDARQRRTFVARLVAVLDDYPDPIAIVFDDAHTLVGSPAEEEFSRLIRLMPPNVRVTLATRSSLLAHRARVNGRILELTTDSLSFTRAETQTLFAQNALDNEGLDALHIAVDGWPAALNLAAMNVGGTTVPRSLEEIMDPNLLYKYLEYEVYDGLSATQQSVLMAAAICPMITVELVDEIHGSLESAEPLRALSDEHALLNRATTDARGRIWYQVRPVLAGFLAEKVRTVPPDRLHGMVERAARWHLRHGDPLVAVQLVADHDDPALLEDVLRQAGYDLVLAGHADSVLSLTSPTASQPDSGPFTRLMVAYAEATVDEFDRAVDLLTTTSPTSLTADELIEWDWLRYVIQLRIAQSRDETTGGLASGRADSTLVRLPVSLRALVHLSRGLADVGAGEPKSARRGLLQSLAVGENRGDVPMQVMSEIGLSSAAMLETDVRATLAHAEIALHLAEESLPDDNHAATATAHGLVSWSLLQLLQTSAARDHADIALRLAERQPNDDLRLQLTHLYEMTHFDSLHDRRRVVQEFTTMWPPSYARVAPLPMAVTSLHEGMTFVAEVDEHRWGDQMLQRALPILGEGHDWQVANALHHFASAKPDARAIVTQLLHDEEAPRVPLSHIVEWSLEAVLEHEANNPFRAHLAMRKALELAENTGSYLSVTRPGRLVGEVLYSGLGRFGELEHVARAVATHYGGTPDMGETEALTPRERELLKELTTLRTVEEISHDLLLSVNTVKTHLRGIYRKLNATSRRQAVAAAERAGLL